MDHKCNQEILLTSIKDDVKIIRQDMKSVLGKVPVLEEKCKQSSKVASIITSTVITLFLGVSLTVLNLTITAAMTVPK